MAGGHADKGGERHSQGGEDHGQEAGLVDVLASAEAYGHGAAGGDHASGGMADVQADGEAEADGDHVLQVRKERKIFPLEDGAVAEEGGAG